MNSLLKFFILFFIFIFFTFTESIGGISVQAERWCMSMWHHYGIHDGWCLCSYHVSSYSSEKERKNMLFDAEKEPSTTLIDWFFLGCVISLLHSESNRNHLFLIFLQSIAIFMNFSICIHFILDIGCDGFACHSANHIEYRWREKEEGKHRLD